MPVKDTGRVLGKLNWAAASVALAVVGVSTFTQPFGRTRNMVSEITAFAIAVLTLALWTATERSPALARLAGLLPFAWGAMAVTCGLASLTSSGGPSISWPPWPPSARETPSAWPWPAPLPVPGYLRSGRPD